MSRYVPRLLRPLVIERRPSSHSDGDNELLSRFDLGPEAWSLLPAETCRRLSMLVVDRVQTRVEALPEQALKMPLPDPDAALKLPIERRTANTLRRESREARRDRGRSRRYLGLRRFGGRALVDLLAAMEAAGVAAPGLIEAPHAAVAGEMLSERALDAALALVAKHLPLSEEQAQQTLIGAGVSTVPIDIGELSHIAVRLGRNAPFHIIDVAGTRMIVRLADVTAARASYRIALRTVQGWGTATVRAVASQVRAAVHAVVEASFVEQMLMASRPSAGSTAATAGSGSRSGGIPFSPTWARCSPWPRACPSCASGMRCFARAPARRRRATPYGRSARRCPALTCPGTSSPSNALSTAPPISARRRTRWPVCWRRYRPGSPTRSYGRCPAPWASPGRPCGGCSARRRCSRSHRGACTASSAAPDPAGKTLTLESATMGPLRPVVSLSMIVAVLAVILGLSIASARRERHRLLDELAATARQQTHASIDVLSARLDALDQDTRLLTDLVERSWPSPEHDSPTERRLAVTAFRALAVVVPHYRVISLNRQDGGIEILAVDPTETEATVGALSPHIEQMAREVSTRGVKAIGEPARYGARSFLLYGVPVRGGGAVVVTSDAAMFLGAGTWTPLPASRLFVTDPGGVVWAGCETPGGCRATDSDTVKTYFANATGVSEIGADAAGTLGVGRAPAVQASEGIDRPTGRWVVTWVASTRAIMDREGWLISRIALAAVAAALTVAGVGMMILRQQRRAFALEGELRYARALADARDLENQLVRAEKLITVGVLSTEMAHEIGSPLAVIRGRAEQVLREVSAGPRAEDLRVIIKHIDNVSATIRQILDFARRPAHRTTAGGSRDCPRTGARAPAMATRRALAHARGRALPRVTGAVSGSGPAAASAREPDPQCLRCFRGGRKGRGRGGRDRRRHGTYRHRRSRLWHRSGEHERRLRSLLHHQATRPRDRARAPHRRQHRPQPWRPDRADERPRPGDDRAGTWPAAPEPREIHA